MKHLVLCRLLRRPCVQCRIIAERYAALRR